MGTSCHHTQSDHQPSQNMWYFKTTEQYKLMMLSLHKPDPRKHSPKHHSDISATNVLAGHGLPECLRAFRLPFLRIKFVMNLPVSGLCHDESYTERSSGKSRDREILLHGYMYILWELVWHLVLIRNCLMSNFGENIGGNSGVTAVLA